MITAFTRQHWKNSGPGLQGSLNRSFIGSSLPYGSVILNTARAKTQPAWSEDFPMLEVLWVGCSCRIWNLFVAHLFVALNRLQTKSVIIMKQKRQLKATCNPKDLRVAKIDTQNRLHLDEKSTEIQGRHPLSRWFRIHKPCNHIWLVVQ